MAESLKEFKNNFKFPISHLPDQIHHPIHFWESMDQYKTRMEYVQSVSVFMLL